METVGRGEPRDDLRKLLNRVGVGYFLCHGETNAHQGAPYLGLGPRPGKPENRIYPNTLVVKRHFVKKVRFAGAKKQRKSLVSHESSVRIHPIARRFDGFGNAPELGCSHTWWSLPENY
jgi:hypothetical protein